MARPSKAPLTSLSGCIFIPLHVSRISTYPIFEVPRIFSGIRTVFRDSVDQRGGTVLCGLLGNVGRLGYGGVPRSEWLSSPNKIACWQSLPLSVRRPTDCCLLFVLCPSWFLWHGKVRPPKYINVSNELNLLIVLPRYRESSVLHWDNIAYPFSTDRFIWNRFIV
jgi:hypothetical protein